MKKTVFELYKLQEGCFVDEGKLKAIGGANALTSWGKRYIKVASKAQLGFLLCNLAIAKERGKVVQFTGIDDGKIVTKIRDIKQRNKKKNTERMVSLSELRSTLSETEGNQVATGKHRSLDRMMEDISRKGGGLGISLGVQDEKKIPDITPKAFAKYPLGQLELLEITRLSRPLKIIKMRELIKKYPQVSR